jgi:hypothetical protein
VIVVKNDAGRATNIWQLPASLYCNSNSANYGAVVDVAVDVGVAVAVAVLVDVAVKVGVTEPVGVGERDGVKVAVGGFEL